MVVSRRQIMMELLDLARKSYDRDCSLAGFIIGACGLNDRIIEPERRDEAVDSESDRTED